MNSTDRQALEDELIDLETQLEDGGTSGGRSLVYLNSLRQQIAELEAKLAQTECGEISR